jgi:hypothetical protein
VKIEEEQFKKDEAPKNQKSLYAYIVNLAYLFSKRFFLFLNTFLQNGALHSSESLI